MNCKESKKWLTTFVDTLYKKSLQEIFLVISYFCDILQNLTSIRLLMVSNGKIHWLWTHNEAFFQWYPKLLGFGRQIGLINFGHLVYFRHIPCISQIWYWPVKSLGNSHHTSVVGVKIHKGEKPFKCSYMMLTSQ